MNTKKLIHCDDLRSLIYFKDGKVITPNERDIDIFSKTSKVIPDWQPKKELQVYEKLTKVYLDIETDLIPPKKAGVKQKAIEFAKDGRIWMIGIRNEKGVTKIIQDQSEFKMLIELRDILEKKQPDLLLTFNGVDFDLPYLYQRFEYHGIDRNPFVIGKKEARFGAAKLAGRPWNEFFTPVYLQIGGRFGNLKKCYHIDLMQLAIAYDAVLRKFTSFSLKDLCIQMGLRSDRRLELSPLEMQRAYDTGDYADMIKYLTFDLEDTELLANALMPSLYYQLTYFPKLNLQQMVTAGNATKWLTLLEDYYGKNYTQVLVRGEMASFKGAITRAVAGVHKWVAAFDFSGQYPSCMRQYGLHSENDPHMIMLAALNHAVQYRNAIKYAKNRTKAQEDISTGAKAPINSSYGSLASIIPYGDTIAAAMVTLMARARILWAIDFIEELGGVVVLSDTDSCLIKTNRTDLHLMPEYQLSEQTMASLPKDAPPQLLSAVAIGEALKKALPDGAALDFDGIMQILFVPPSTVPKDYDKPYRLNSTVGKRFAYKHLQTLAGDGETTYLDQELIDQEIANYGHEKVTYSLLKAISDRHNLNFPDFIAIKKNYIKLEWASKKQQYVLKAKGKFVKRDRFKLEKTFQQKYLELLVDSKAKADDYYYQVLAELYSGNYPIEDLQVTRTIRVGEVKLILLGIGVTHERVSFHIGTNNEPTKKGAYSIDHYVEKIKRLYQEMNVFNNDDILKDLKEDTLKLFDEQLNLFKNV